MTYVVECLCVIAVLFQTDVVFIVTLFADAAEESQIESTGTGEVL